MHDVVKLMLPSDAGRALGVSATRVKQLAAIGLLPVAATTESGLRLFHPAHVEKLRQERETRSRRPVKAAE